MLTSSAESSVTNADLVLALPPEKKYLSELYSEFVLVNATPTRLDDSCTSANLNLLSTSSLAASTLIH